MLKVCAAILLASSFAYADSITVTTTSTTTSTITGDTEPATRAPGLTPVVTDAPPKPAPLRVPSVRITVAAGPALGFDTKDDCAQGECVGVHVQFGRQIAPQLLLLATGALMTPPDAKDRHYVATLSVQAWATPRLWGELGLGVGSKRTWKYPEPPPMDLSGVAPAGAAAVGFEILRRHDYALGIQARFASTTDVHHTSFGQLLAALSWF